MKLYWHVWLYICSLNFTLFDYVEITNLKAGLNQFRRNGIEFEIIMKRTDMNDVEIEYETTDNLNLKFLLQ